MTKYFFTILVVLAAVVAAGILSVLYSPGFSSEIYIETETSFESEPQEKETSREQEIKSPETPITITQQILFNAPFTAQAPFGEWSDPRQQDACEEASALIAVSWARGESFTLDEAKEKILDISFYQTENYDTFVDTSAADTLKRIINDYFGFYQASLQNNVSLDEIKQELAYGNVVIAPTNGQALGNPNYTPPGPERHMLVIIGYDPERRQFITNDPGTRQGKNYRYDEDVLYNAIRDYPTGNHKPILGYQKNIILVKRS